MKTKLRLLTTIAMLGTTLATAQDERRPERDGRALPNPNPPPDRRASPLSPAPFLGIATSPLPPVLSAQLGLPDGFGLVVDEVVPDSPADQAGVKRFDVLRQFNDQNLVDPNQLATLVRAQASGTEVSLTLLRKGQEQKVAMKIAERPMPEHLRFPAPTGEIREQIERLKDGVGDKARKLEEQVREFERRMREYQERLRKWRGHPEAEMPKPPEFHPPAEPADSPRERQPDTPAPERRAELRSTATSKVLMKDDSGEIEVTSTDGQRHLIARGIKGETIFDGPIDTPEQLKALPEELRKKIETIDVRTKVDPMILRR